MLNKTLKCLSRRHLPKLPKLLESEDVNMRIAAGETIALLFELARDLDCVSLAGVSSTTCRVGLSGFDLHSVSCVNPPLQDFEFEDWDELCDKLSTLATDCNKHRAKTDKRKQRSVFRDVLKAVEVSEASTASKV